MFSPITLDDLPPLVILPLGAVIFVILIAFHALAGVVYAVIFPETDMLFAALISLIIGLMFSSALLFEIVIGKLFVSKNRKTQIYLMLGQSLVWVACIGLFIEFLAS